MKYGYIIIGGKTSVSHRVSSSTVPSIMRNEEKKIK